MDRTLRRYYTGSGCKPVFLYNLAVHGRKHREWTEYHRGLVDGVPSYNDVDLDFGYVDYTKKITPRWKSVSSYTPATKPNTDSYNGSSSRHNGWVETESGKTYYYTNGKKAKGWKTIEGKTYYFDQNTGVMYQKKLFTVDGKIYYVNKYGIRVSDRWEKI